MLGLLAGAALPLSLAVAAAPAQAADPAASFQNSASNTCLTRPTGHHSPRVSVVLADCAFDATQLWTEAEPGHDKAGNPTTTSRLVNNSSGGCLNWAFGTGIGLGACTSIPFPPPGTGSIPDPHQVWTRVDAGNNEVFLQTQGRRLATDADGFLTMAAGDADTPNTRWRAIPAGAA